MTVKVPFRRSRYTATSAHVIALKPCKRSRFPIRKGSVRSLPLSAALTVFRSHVGGAHNCLKPQVARENMAQVALIGHSRPRTARVRARMSQTLSDHAVANSWWSPSSLPAWLNEKFYIQKIQPELRRFKVREIAQAMQVSQLYAAFIRSGRRRPHPRHWQVLAELVGVIRPVQVSVGRDSGDNS
jgi:hypothetical protein